MSGSEVIPQAELELLLEIMSILALDDSIEAEVRAMDSIARHFKAEATTASAADEAMLLRRMEAFLAPVFSARNKGRKELSVLMERQAFLLLQERRLADLADGSPEMIYTTGPDDIITSMNQAGAQMLGYDDPEGLAGRRFSEIALNPEDRTALLQRLALDRRVANYEIVLLRKDGSPIYCLESVSAMRMQPGEPIGFQGIVRDISERIMMESELLKNNLELANLNQKLETAQSLMIQQEKLASIGHLAAGIAHEINNPLGFLKSNFETTMGIIKDFYSYVEKSHADRENPNAFLEAEAYFLGAFDDLQDIFKESDDGFNRIIRIVRDMKSFSRTDQCGDLMDIDLNAEIESALAIAWNEIKYVAEVQKTLGAIPAVKGRSGEIGQVIINMLVNAAQAIASQQRNEKGKIEISTARIGSSIRIAIRDDGPGIPAELRSKIFDPFYTTKGPGEGTGLGLSISHEIIVNRYSGRLEVASEPGKGTAFIIALPVDNKAS
jgi:two-component system NtrC family sensor kinase